MIESVSSERADKNQSNKKIDNSPPRQLAPDYSPPIFRKLAPNIKTNSELFSKILLKGPEAL